MAKNDKDDRQSLSPELRAKIDAIDFTKPIVPSHQDQLDTERFINALEAASKKFGLFKIL